MILTQAEINMVTRGKCRRLLLPVERGALGELLPCRLEEGVCFSLQPRPFVKGTRVTCTSIEVSTLGQMDGTWVGLAVKGGDRPVWVVAFVLGDRSDFYRRHRERYLKAKGVGLTDDPKRAARGEPAVTEAEQLEFSAVARQKREAAERYELRELRRVTASLIRKCRVHDLTPALKQELRYMEGRLSRIDRHLDRTA